jgi:hypothetical protein
MICRMRNFHFRNRKKLDKINQRSIRPKFDHTHKIFLTINIPPIPTPFGIFDQILWQSGIQKIEHSSLK